MRRNRFLRFELMNRLQQRAVEHGLFVVLQRAGILARHGRDVPLNRINDVSFSETILERILRSGTLVVESAGERGQISLTDVPSVERVQRELYRMVEEHQGRRDAAAAEPDPQP